jgi:hypothetical protein
MGVEPGLAEIAVVPTAKTPEGASAKAALGAAPHRLKNIIAAAVTALRSFENCIYPSFKAVGA